MQINILIAEDEKNIRRSLSEFIIELGAPYKLVGSIANGSDALKLLETNTVHILLTDIRMPIIDGLSLIKKVRSTNKDIRIIVLSAYQDFDYLHEAMLYNISDYLLKPFKRDALLRTISKATENMHATVSEYSSLLTNQQKWDLPLIRLESTLFDQIMMGDTTNTEVSIGIFLEALWKKSNNDTLILIPYLIDSMLSLRKNLASIDEALQSIEDDWNDLKLILVPETKHYVIDNQIKEFVMRCSDVVNMMRIQTSPSMIHLCLEILEKNYAKDIKLYDLAKQIGVDTSYLSKLLKKELGVNFSEYITELRVNKAKELLMHPHLKIMEIATMVGYKNPYYLTRVFKKHTNVTPKEYREREIAKDLVEKESSKAISRRDKF